MQDELKSADRKYLRGLAHHLKPIVQIGKEGVTDNLIRELETALEAHELIKAKFVDHKDERQALTQSIVERCSSNSENPCSLVGLIGNVAILYRPSSNSEQRKIAL